MVASVTAATKGAEALGAQAMAFSKAVFENQVAAAKSLAGAKSVQEAVELQTAFAKSALEAYMAQFGAMSETVSASVKDSDQAAQRARHRGRREVASRPLVASSSTEAEGPDRESGPCSGSRSAPLSPVSDAIPPSSVRASPKGRPFCFAGLGARRAPCRRSKSVSPPPGSSCPSPSPPSPTTCPSCAAGDLVHISGQVSLDANGRHHAAWSATTSTWRPPSSAARLCGINLLAQMKAACDGDLDRVDRVVKLGGFVQAGPDFFDIPKVINGCSDLMVEVFGDAGRHARSAVGVYQPAVELRGRGRRRGARWAGDAAGPEPRRSARPGTSCSSPPIAHRGLWTPDGAPENSLAAFQAACAAGYGIELDVQLTADGEAMVFHDDNLERMTGAEARLRDRTAADLRELRLAGHGRDDPDPGSRPWP